MATQTNNPDKERKKHYEVMFVEGADMRDDFGFLPNPPYMFDGRYGELLAHLKWVCDRYGVTVWAIEETQTIADLEPSYNAALRFRKNEAKRAFTKWQRKELLCGDGVNDNTTNIPV